jgi:hypothetical protein
MLLEHADQSNRAATRNSNNYLTFDAATAQNS